MSAAMAAVPGERVDGDGALPGARVDGGVRSPARGWVGPGLKARANPTQCNLRRADGAWRPQPSPAAAMAREGLARLFRPGTAPQSSGVSGHRGPPCSLP